MLKNENLKQINSTITLLTTIKLYLLENNTADFIDKTGIDLVDIQHNIKNLIAIHTQETLKHTKASKKANAWNKAHPEQHRKHNRETHKRHPRKEYQKEYYQKNKKRIAEYRRKHYHENEATREYYKNYSKTHK